MNIIACKRDLMNFLRDYISSDEYHRDKNQNKLINKIASDILCQIVLLTDDYYILKY